MHVLVGAADRLPRAFHRGVLQVVEVLARLLQLAVERAHRAPVAARPLVAKLPEQRLHSPIRVCRVVRIELLFGSSRASMKHSGLG